MKKIILTLMSLLSVMSLAMFAGCGEDPHEHAFGSELQHNDTHHYYVCECGEKKDETAHTFDKEVAEETYFKEEGAETVTFFKSCVCGVKGSDTFSVDKTEGVFESFIIVDKTYDGNACSLTFDTNSNETATVEYKIQGADDSTYTTTAPVDAGEYTVRVSVAGNRVYSPVSQTKDFTISKCEISGLNKSFTYNGSDKQTVDIPTLLVPESGISLELTFEDANVNASVIGVKVLKDGVETKNYEVKSNCTANIVAKYLRFEDVYVKNYDGTNVVRFDFNDALKDGVAAEEGVYVKIEALEYDTPENLPLVNAGYYAKADFGLAQFYTSDNLPTDNYAFDDNDFQGGWSGFKLWILDTNPLVIEVTNKAHTNGDYILGSDIKQGSVKVGDSIILPGTPDKVYVVLKIEKFQKEQGQATVGEEVGIYIDGMADLAEVSGGDLLYTQNNIPQLTTTFFASIYAKTQEEGGRQTPFVNGYKPNIVGLSASQQATINIIDVYGKDDTYVFPGDSALVKITLTNALPVSLLENLEFTMIDGGRVTVTGVGVDYVESSNHENSMVATDNFDTEAGIPMVIRLTNTRSETLDTLQFYVSNGSGGGSYLTDFTIKLYDSSFTLVEGTFNNTEGSFTKTDSSKWSIAAKETCYIVITTTNATADVFAWLG